MSDADTPRTSIRRQLMLFLAASLLLLIVGAAAVSYGVAVHAANEAYDRALLDPAIKIAESIRGDAAEARLEMPRNELDALLFDQLDGMFFQVRIDRDRVVDGADDLPFPAVAPMAGAHVFYDALYHGDSVRVLALKATGGVIVQVGETLHKRNRLVQEMLVAGLAPTLLVAGIAIALAWAGVARGLRPLDRVRDDLLSRSPEDLRPISEEHAAVEIVPVVDAFNRLLSQLRAASELQQRFVANAAHQLRTPLAGLQMHLELLSQRDLPEDIRSEVGRMHGATTRAGRLANQLLTLTRTENNPMREGPREIIDLTEIAGAAADRWAPKAIAQRIDLGFALERAPIVGDALMISELLDNLVDNALRYTPAGGEVTVRTGQREGASYLCVEDTGPGIPEAERGRVMERFYRLAGATGDGSGLGLAIVKEIADRHSASVEIFGWSTRRGTCVRIEFPIPDSPDA